MEQSNYSCLIDCRRNADTSSPKNVERDIDNLLDEYNHLKKISIEDIIDFHYRFECIHPYGDGNGLGYLLETLRKS